MVAALFIAGGSLLAQEQTGGSGVSITVSNQADAVLTLRVQEMPTPQRPPSLTSSGLAPQQTSSPTVPERHPPHRMFSTERTFQPKRGAALQLPSGEYHLDTMGPPIGGKMLRPLQGFISITNAEVWLFKLEEQDEKYGQASLHWKLEVPSRPGLDLSQIPQSSFKLAPNPLRPPRAALVPALPSLPRPPTTNTAQ